jgi:hypothetical protein
VKQFAIVILISATVLLAQNKSPQKKRGTVCWPLGFAGVVVGTTDDSQTQRLLGAGVFRADEGHTGGRYYVDPKRTATLHIIEGVDKVIEEVIVSEGIDHTLKANEIHTAVSRWFDTQQGFGNWHALHLGSSKDAVLENLGEPQKKTTGDRWVYETACACELPEYLTLTFKRGRVVQLSLYAGD